LFFSHFFRFNGAKLQKKAKKYSAEAIFSLFTFHFSLFFVPLHPLFGVIAGRKYREACYVALERYSNN